VSYDTLLEYLSKASIGIHTMTDEHFGIGVIEYMASGLIPLAHNSGGPKMDIVTEYKGQKTGFTFFSYSIGFLAKTVHEYAEALTKMILMSNEERQKIQKNARAAAMAKFSSSLFARGFIDSLKLVAE
jgi:alpha-1,2-mannosyltransferase